MKYIKLYDNRHDFVFEQQRFFPNTSLVDGEDEPTYFTDVEEVVFELTVTLPTEKVITGQTYTLAVEYGGADVFSEATVTTTGDVTLNGTQFTANTDGDFSVTATYDGKTVTLNGTSKLMTAAPRTGINDTGCGIYNINIYGNAPKRITFNGEEFTPSQQEIFNYKVFYADLTEQTVFVTATAQEEGKWESDVATATYTIPVLQTLTASISDDTLEDGQTAQITVKYGNQNVTEDIGIMYTASGDVTCSNGDGIFHKGAGVVTATYSTGSGSIVVSHNGRLGNPNLTPITINVTVAQPQVATNIVFADNDVKTIVANAYGSNGEITEEQAAAVTTFMSGSNTTNNPFYKNANVDSFDEFAYFTGVTEIGVNAFQDCYNMQSITLPSSLTYIPDYAFSGCSSLESVTIPAAVTYIGYRAFNGCSSLESITIGAGVSSMSKNVFDGCSDLTYISVNANNSYFNDGNGSNVIIDGSGNLLYGGRACTVIPNTAYTIGQSAFSGRHLLNNTITIPSSVTSIGVSVFYNCDELTSITIPNSVTSIGNRAFQGCDGLTSVTIGNSVASIGGYAFQNCSALTSVTIPSSVTEIGNDAFNGCTSLSFIIFDGDRPTKLGARAFTNTNDCPIYVPAAYVNNWSVYRERIQAIENIVFADNDVKSILANAFGSNGEINTAQAAAVTTFMSGTNSSTNPFYGNTSVDSFDEFATYFTGVTEIGTAAFYGCNNMTSITIPENVTYIGNQAFRNCAALESISIPENVTYIGNQAFRNCAALESISIPASVTSMGERIFDGCTYLEDIYVDSTNPYFNDGNGSNVIINDGHVLYGGGACTVIDDSLMPFQIDSYAFSGRHFVYDKLTIPSCIMTISAYAFYNISGLTTLKMKATTPPTLGSNNSFENVTIYVPEESVDTYKQASGWSAFASNIQATHYETAVLDCSQLKDADPLESCFNGYYDEKLEDDVVYQEPRIDCTFSGNVAVENGVITMSDDSTFDGFMVDASLDSIVYIKLTHPSADYKVNTSYVEFNGQWYDHDAVTVTFDSATLTTTISNFVPPEGIDATFDGSDFSMQFNSNGKGNPIKITQIEVVCATLS